MHKNNPTSTTDIDLGKDRGKDVIAMLDGRALDGRTKEAKEIAALQEAFAKNPRQTAQAALRAALSFNTVLSKKIMNLALQEPDDCIVDGRLSPLLGIDLVKFQKAIIANLETLLKIAPADQGKSGDSYADVVLEAEQSDQ